VKCTGICLITENAPRLADFYAEVLGVEAEGDDVQVELRAQGAGTGSVTLAFRVQDVDAEYERLKTLGVAFVKPPQTHPWGARSFWFRDPDGHIISSTFSPFCRRRKDGPMAVPRANDAASTPSNRWRLCAEPILRTGHKIGENGV